MRSFFSVVGTLLLSSVPFQAQAYIGPGMGLGMVSIVLGIFVAFILLLVGLVWLPIRRVLRQRKKDREENLKHKSTNPKG
jgi:Na+/melibiose symporter-like transporter